MREDEHPFDFLLRIIAEAGFGTTPYFRTNTWRRRQAWLPDVIERVMAALVEQRKRASPDRGYQDRSRYELAIDLRGTMVIVVVDERESSIHNIHYRDYA